MDEQKTKNQKRFRRKKRVRAKVYGTAECPRLNVFKSNKYMFGQLINDQEGVTMASAHSKTLDNGQKAGKNQTEEPVEFRLGRVLAEKALEKDIKQAVFDRNGYKYHGKVKNVAEGARAGGLEF